MPRLVAALPPPPNLLPPSLPTAPCRRPQLAALHLADLSQKERAEVVGGKNGVPRLLQLDVDRLLQNFEYLQVGAGARWAALPPTFTNCTRRGAAWAHIALWRLARTVCGGLNLASTSARDIDAVALASILPANSVLLSPPCRAWA